MLDLKKIVEDNPKLSMFIIGVIVTLLILIVVSLFRAETLSTVPSVKFIPFKPNTENTRDPRFFAENLTESQTNDDLTRPTPHIHKSVQTSGMATPTSRTNPSQTENMDTDSVATEHMLARGSAERAITDSSRTRYLGLAKLGAADYEGYVYQGEPLSDEQGELTATVYGINSSPWEALRR